MNIETKYSIDQIVYFIDHFGINYGVIKKLNVNVVKIRAIPVEIRTTYDIGGFFQEEERLFPSLEALMQHLATIEPNDSDAPRVEEEPF